MDTAGLDTAAASASSLAFYGGTQTFTTMGPGLVEGMGGAATVAALNSWGATRDRELVQLKADLGATRIVVSTAFDQAKAALFVIVNDFRLEAGTMRHDSQIEAAQSLSRLEQVVGEARAKFDTQDMRVSDGLRELALRLQAVDAWAQAEPARVAAILQAPPRSSAGRGGRREERRRRTPRSSRTCRRSPRRRRGRRTRGRPTRPRRRRRCRIRGQQRQAARPLRPSSPEDRATSR